ncbi:MAG: hypothetical protein NT088_02150 [Candidatus Omnitrophica bacterium]|nr:hypothetical protein [Candidatus Omnitrophota bacterium]
MKKAQALLLTMVLCFSVFAFAETDKEKAAAEFKALNEDFKEETSLPPYSDYVYKNKYWMSDSGRAIIAMGKRALPFLMDELQNGNYWYATAVDYITGIRMAGTTGDDLAGRWLAWWEENKDNPEWNLFIEGKPQSQEGPAVGLNEDNNY